MGGSSKSGRRALGVVLASTAILAGTAATASAAPGSITNVGDTFSAPLYAHDAGTVAQFVHGGGNQHNVTAVALFNGQPLFSSATIGAGSTPVNGTQFIAAGDYPFYCSVHPLTMNATLRVTGTPLPRPITGAGTGAKKKKCKKGRKRKHGKCVRKRKHRRR